LSLTQELQSNCVNGHVCVQEPGLFDAIKAENIPLIYALLKSGHNKVNINNFRNTNLADFIQETLNFISIAADLPQSLFSQLMKLDFCNEHMENLVIMPPLHFIVC